LSIYSKTAFIFHLYDKLNRCSLIRHSGDKEEDESQQRHHTHLQNTEIQ